MGDILAYPQEGSYGLHWTAARCPLSNEVQDSCGVVGVYAPGKDVARIAFHGLAALQHRGQESAGIATADGQDINIYTSMGLVNQVFREHDLEVLQGHIAIGHTRYSTTGSSRLQNAQPIRSRGPEIELALGHNGNVVNALELRHELKEWGATFTSSTDSEIIAHLLAWCPGKTWTDRVGYIMRRLLGAYSLVVTTRDTLIGIRDPLGVRPLCIGQMGSGWVIASESCALDQMGAQFLREVEPGEAIIIDRQGLRSILPRGASVRRAPCVFENIYFARPDSMLDGKLVYGMRMAMGAELAREHPVNADLVIGIPDSATAAAVGYSQESGIPYGEGLLKNRSVGRTFIESDQQFRSRGVRLKFSPLPDVIRGKKLVVVDDSIVRGTTTPHVVSLLRNAGAQEIHMRVCAPPIRHPCHLGIDMASKAELIAAYKEIEEVRQFIGAESLGFLSVNGLLDCVDGRMDNFCTACFTGAYPIPVQLELDKLRMENI